jgi:pyruvate formate lyase activating enzyme
MARRIAMEEGLRYAYVGNVWGHEGESTYCPGCGKPVVRRVGFTITEMNLDKGACRFCGESIPGVWS